MTWTAHIGQIDMKFATRDEAVEYTRKTNRDGVVVKYDADTMPLETIRITGGEIIHIGKRQQRASTR